MKAILVTLIALLILTTQTALGQNQPYIGGFGNGQTTSELVSYSFGNTAQEFAYFGGAGDGNTSNDLVQYSYINPPMFYAYFGGDGDGRAADSVTPYSFMNPPMFYAFFGGAGDGYAGDTFLLIPSTPLASGLLSFEGYAEGGAHLLKWLCSDEGSLSMFVLERSADGVHFKTLESISPKSGTAANEYIHPDRAPLSGKNYYRLKLADVDGSYHYSNVVLLIREGSGGPSLVLFPNPARNSLQLNHSNLRKGTIARVMDMRGVMMWNHTPSATSGMVSLPIERWPPGSYLLQLSAPDGWHQEIRFVKQ